MSPGNGQGPVTPLPVGTLSNLRVQTYSAPNVGESYTITVLVNWSPTLTCTISDLYGYCEDTTNSVTIAAGDLMIWLQADASAGAAATSVSWSLTHTAP